jgi:hypothetical protein
MRADYAEPPYRAQANTFINVREVAQIYDKVLRFQHEGLCATISGASKVCDLLRPAAWSAPSHSVWHALRPT